MTVLGQGWVAHVLRVVIASVYKCTVLWQLTEETVYRGCNKISEIDCRRLEDY